MIDVDSSTIELILTEFKSGGYAAIVFIVFLILFFNAEKLATLFQVFRSRKLSDFEDALKSDVFQGYTLDHLRKQFSRELYKKAVGIDIEPSFREMLIKHYQNIGVIDFRHYKRALPHFTFDNNKLEIVVTKPARVFSFISAVIGLLTFAVFIVFVFIFIPFSDFTSFSGLMKAYFMAFMIVPLGMFFLWLSSPVISADQIIKAESLLKPVDDKPNET